MLLLILVGKLNTYLIIVLFLICISHMLPGIGTLPATGTKKLEGLVQEMDGLDSSSDFGLPCLAS